MLMWNRHTKLLAVLVSFAALTASAQTRKEFKFNVGPGANVNISNDLGPVSVKAGPGSQVLVTAILRSNQAEVAQSQVGSRIELRTRYPQQRPTGDAARVDYQVTVPADCAVSIRSSAGPITIERIRGDVSAEGDSANIDVHDSGNGHIHVRSLKGNVTLSNITNGHVEVTSVGGPVTLTDVSGPRIEINTTNGKITYRGAFASNGDYDFTTHSGDIDVWLPASASVDVSASSLSGKVENDFPFQPKARSAANLVAGRSFAGTSNQGGSAVQLRSFSGTIRVKKQ